MKEECFYEKPELFSLIGPWLPCAVKERYLEGMLDHLQMIAVTGPSGHT